MAKKMKLIEFLHLEHKDSELSFLHLLLSKSKYPAIDCYQYAKNIINDDEKNVFASILFHHFINYDKCHRFHLFVTRDIEKYLESKSNDIVIKDSKHNKIAFEEIDPDESKYLLTKLEDNINELQKKYPPEM